MPSLFLRADDPHWIPVEQRDLLRRLGELGLIDPVAKTVGDAEKLRVGEHFLRLVTFLGCAPQVALDADQAGDGQAVCFLRQHLHADIRFRVAAGSVGVRCPRCRTLAVGAQAHHLHPAHDALYTCGHCDETTPYSGLDWRQSAGFARCFVEIGGIYPHEAVPSDKLLATLSACSGTAWRYFYAA